MKQDEGEVIFYKKDAESSIYSNFYPAPIAICLGFEDSVWPTVEHYFQAMKFYCKDNVLMNEIHRSTSPSEAYRLGWSSTKIWDDWERVRNGVMREAVKAKFTQHEDLKKQLIETKGKRIIQVCNSDLYWGASKAREGRNMLGEILMSVRDEILWDMAK